MFLRTPTLDLGLFRRLKVVFFVLESTPTR